MQYLLNKDLTRNYDYRPYINLDEYTYQTRPYNPNSYDLDQGLYSRTQPSLPYFIDTMWQFVTDNNLSLDDEDYVDKGGRQHYSSQRANYGMPSSYVDLKFVKPPPSRYY